MSDASRKSNTLQHGIKCVNNTFSKVDLKLIKLFRVRGIYIHALLDNWIIKSYNSFRPINSKSYAIVSVFGSKSESEEISVDFHSSTPQIVNNPI